MLTVNQSLGGTNFGSINIIDVDYQTEHDFKDVASLVNNADRNSVYQAGRKLTKVVKDER